MEIKHKLKNKNKHKNKGKRESTLPAAWAAVLVCLPVACGQHPFRLPSVRLTRGNLEGSRIPLDLRNESACPACQKPQG